ncbi:hypothetical protein FOVSG1_006333 [Fusarium oxysporum f. sp. vasinfectum]
MRSLSLLGSCLLYAGLAQSKPYGSSEKAFLPFKLVEGPSIPQVLSQEGQLDGPKLTPGVPYIDGPLNLQISGTFENGTWFLLNDEATGGAVIESGTNGVSGKFKGAGASFEGSSLNDHNPEYTITVNNKRLGVYGKMTLRSVSPPHYPCDINKAGVSQEIIPNVFWSNAQPDAIATVDFVIQGKPIKFTGVGYHDKNWASSPIEKETRSWYWGHGRVGPYSLVWYDTVTPNGKEYFSSWITKNGKIVSKSCEPNAVVVRPWGENEEFPPARGSPAPSGYTMRYDLGEKGIFVANFTRETITLETDTYKRMIGSITGGFEGKKQHKGRSLCEQFQF